MLFPVISDFNHWKYVDLEVISLSDVELSVSKQLFSFLECRYLCAKTEELNFSESNMLLE